MRSKTRSAVLLAGLLLLTTACTPEQISLYVDSTAATRDVLSAQQLGRLRACESDDYYGAISSSGLYRGAYQFDQSTWDELAARHFPWLVGRDPATVAPWWQDAMARALWSERGSQPWPNCGSEV